MSTGYRRVVRALRTGAVSVPAAELENMTAVAKAAVSWWRNRCPVVWGIGRDGDEQHLENPTVNTTSDSEAALATAVAALVRSGKPQGGRRR